MANDEKDKSTFTEEELLAKINEYLDSALKEENIGSDSYQGPAKEKNVQPLESENRPDKLSKLLDYYYQREDYDKVIELCQSNQNNWISFYFLGKVYNKKNEFEKAFDIFSKTDFDHISDVNLKSDIYAEKAKSYLSQNKAEESRKFFEESARLNPENKMAILGMASLDFLNYNYGEALIKYNKILESDGKNIYALLGIGNVYRAIGRVDEAVSSFKKVVELDEENVDALNGLLRCAYLNRDFSVIETALDKYLELHQADINIQFVAASVYYEQKKYERALKSLDTIMIFNNNYPGAQELREKIVKEMRGF